MSLKNFLHSTLLAVCLALIAGLLIGAIFTRWHYKQIYKGYTKPCGSGGSVTYYDQTGKNPLYKVNGCNQPAPIK
jgi:hypothetical protein